MRLQLCQRPEDGAAFPLFDPSSPAISARLRCSENRLVLRVDVADLHTLVIMLLDQQGHSFPCWHGTSPLHLHQRENVFSPRLILFSIEDEISSHPLASMSDARLSVPGGRFGLSYCCTGGKAELSQVPTAHTITVDPRL